MGSNVTGSAPDPRGVLAAFGLPGEVTAYAEVSGGWSNRVWRLSTTRGRLAVKELRNAWGEPRWLDWLAEGWRRGASAAIAGMAIAGAGSGDPPRRRGLGRGRCGSDGSGDGARARAPLGRGRDRAARAGRPAARALGRDGRSPTVHASRCSPTTPELYAGRTGLTTADVWPDLVVALARGGRAVDRRARARPSALARRASALLVDDGSRRRVLCHGDVDQKNLLVARRRPAAHRLGRRAPGRPAHDLAARRA